MINLLTASGSRSNVSLISWHSSARPCVAAVKYANEPEQKDKHNFIIVIIFIKLSWFILRPTGISIKNIFPLRLKYYFQDNNVTLTKTLQDLDSFLHITSVQRIVVLATHVLADFS